MDLGTDLSTIGDWPPSSRNPVFRDWHQCGDNGTIGTTRGNCATAIIRLCGKVCPMTPAPPPSLRWFPLRAITGLAWSVGAGRFTDADPGVRIPDVIATRRDPVRRRQPLRPRGRLRADRAPAGQLPGLYRRAGRG